MSCGTQAHHVTQAHTGLQECLHRSPRTAEGVAQPNPPFPYRLRRPTPAHLGEFQREQRDDLGSSKTERTRGRFTCTGPQGTPCNPTPLAGRTQSASTHRSADGDQNITEISLFELVTCSFTGMKTCITKLREYVRVLSLNAWMQSFSWQQRCRSGIFLQKKKSHHKLIV